MDNLNYKSIHKLHFKDIKKKKKSDTITEFIVVHAFFI